MYNKAVELSNVIQVRDIGENDIVVIRNDADYGILDTIEQLGSPQANLIVGSKEEKQRMLGRILGYKQEDIDEFVKNPPDCDCRWCRYE